MSNLILGAKAKSDFDAIVKQILRSDWSVDPPSPDVHYVMWGRPQAGEGGDSDGCRPLGRLSSTDLAELVERTVVTYGESLIALAGTVARLYMSLPGSFSK